MNTSKVGPKSVIIPVRSGLPSTIRKTGPPLPGRDRFDVSRELRAVLEEEVEADGNDADVEALVDEEFAEDDDDD